MSVKCPACGFDSPDGAEWCDFCKEPLRKKKGAAALEELKKLPTEKLLERLPDELRKGADREEKLPSWAPWVRPAAYAFLVLMALLLTILRIVGISTSRRAEPEDAGRQTAPNIP